MTVDEPALLQGTLIQEWFFFSFFSLTFLSLFFYFGFKYLQVINIMSSRQRLNKSTKIVPKIIGLEGRILYFMVVVVVVYGGLCVCMLCVY